LDLDPIFAGK
jgi:hypothetical protein